MSLSTRARDLRDTPRPPRRHRGRQVTLLVVVIVLGLGSRRETASMPVLIVRYAGDTLWTTAVFLALGLAWPGVRTRWLAAAAAMISLVVELSQLAQPDWLQSVRQWPGAGLLLGYDFVATDLVCYAVGVALGVAIDTALGLNRHRW